MSKYKYVLTYEDGRTLDSVEEYGDYSLDESTFDTYGEAEEAALYAVGCSKQGAEILHMSNPGDYDYNEDEKIDIDIIETD